MNTSMEDDEMTAFFESLDSRNNPSSTPLKKEVARKEPPPEKRHTCLECNGTGLYKGVRIHQEKEHCFACKGKGYFLKSYAERFAAKQKREEAKARKAAKQLAVFDEQYPGLREKLNQYKWAGFIGSMIQNLNKWNSLTDKQVQASLAVIAKIEEKLAEKAKQREQKTGSVDVSRIMEMFNKASSSGLRHPVYRCEKLTMSLASTNGKNPGAIYVKCNGEYAGKIMAGQFTPVNSAPEDILKLVQEVADNPLGKAREYGRITGSCSCCGRTLSNTESIEAGIGPICASKWGL